MKALVNGMVVLLALLAGGLLLVRFSDSEDVAQLESANVAPHDTDATASEGRSDLPPGTPEGGILDWVDDIRAGLDDVREAAEAGTDGLQSRVLTLYVGRQEYLEMVYGPQGHVTGSSAPALADAIMAAEAHFHELMGLAAEPSPTAARVDESIARLEDAYAVVVEEAREAGVPLRSLTR